MRLSKNGAVRSPFVWKFDVELGVLRASYLGYLHGKALCVCVFRPGRRTCEYCGLTRPCQQRFSLVKPVVNILCLGIVGEVQRFNVVHHQEDLGLEVQLRVSTFWA